MSAKKRKPLTAVNEEDAASLNRAFYAADPADYFARRLRYLLGLAAHSDEEIRAEAAVHRFGKLEMIVPSTEVDAADNVAHKRFVLLEAEMLVHHVGETLMRMFLAHSGAPQVPWIEVATLRGPGDFARQLKQLVKRGQSEGLLDEVGHVFLGCRTYPIDCDEEARSAQDAARRRIADYLLYFAGLLLNRAQTYNAVKHGLAMQPGEPAIRVGHIEGLSAKGPALSHLSRSRDEHGSPQWVVTTRWIPVELDLSIAYIGKQLLATLWQVARLRYANWPPPRMGSSCEFQRLRSPTSKGRPLRMTRWR
jgi:hypothetical protein